MTLFEAPFEASVLSDHENNALQACSLMAMPPPAPGMPSLVGLTTVDLPGTSLSQWASHIQDIASGMRMPLEAAVNSAGGHCGGFKPVREVNTGEILSPLLWSQQKV